MTEREFFAEALLRNDPAERAAFLDEACPPGSRVRIEELLNLHADSDLLLDRAPLEFLGAGEEPPRPEGRSTPTPETAARTLEPFLTPSMHPGALGGLGHYEALGVLGQGGFGIVIRAFDARLHRIVAIKILAPHLALTAPPRRRFLREARAAAQVRHGNVVQIHDVEERPLPYLVMEYVEGLTLQERLQLDGPLAAAEVVRLGRQIALGLAAAHEKGLIHRDVKPANILLDAGEEPCAKLTDFGLARADDDASLAQSDVVAGTPAYMAPEQARGEALDQRTDLFSLGGVLYAMATGHPPFRGPNTLAVLRLVIEDLPRPVREVREGLPEGLCTVIMRLLEKDPAARFATAREAAEALGRCLTIPAPAPPKPARRRRLVLDLAATLAVAAAVVLAVPDPGEVPAASKTRSLAATARPPRIIKPAPPKPKPAPPKAVDPEADRKAADWLVYHGGVMRLDGETAEIKSVFQLPPPPGRFTITWVGLHGNQVADRNLAHMQQLTGLSQLYMSSSSVTDAGLKSLRDCTGLTLIHMHDTAVTDAGLAHLKGLSGLRVLAMNDTEVSDAGLAHFAGHPALQSLAVAQTAVGDAGLAHLKGVAGLLSLFLEGNRVTDSGLVHLASHTGLIELNLCRLPLTDEGISALAGLTKLEKLSLKKTSVTDAGLVHLEGLGALRHLDLTGTRVTRLGRERLHQSLPRCMIKHEDGNILP